MRTMSLCALCLVLSGCGDSGQDVGPIKTSAHDLFEAYKTDAVEAEREYSDKVLVVSEVKGTIDKENSGVFVLSAHNVRVTRPVMTVPQYQLDSIANVKALPGIIMKIKTGQENRFPGLLRTEGIVVRGWCKGVTTDPTTLPGFYVVLENCEFVGNSR